MQRLNRKRKTSCERELDKAKSKKICLERSVTKTLLTLSRHAGKSKEERDMTLLDLSSERVASSGEPDEESIQEFEPEERVLIFTDERLHLSYCTHT